MVSENAFRFNYTEFKIILNVVGGTSLFKGNFCVIDAFVYISGLKPPILFKFEIQIRNGAHYNIFESDRQRMTIT